MVGANDARVIAVERFDLDDLGALVGQQHGAEGTGQHLREVDDADAVEGAERCLGAHLSPQWLRRLMSTVRSPSKMCLSSWFTP